MGDSAAVAGNVPANPAIFGAFPSASGRKTKPSNHDGSAACRPTKDY